MTRRINEVDLAEMRGIIDRELTELESIYHDMVMCERQQVITIHKVARSLTDEIEQLLAENDRYKAALEAIQLLLSGEGETRDLMAIITFAHVEANKALNPQESEKG